LHGFDRRQSSGAKHPERGTLDLWCNGQKMERYNIRRRLRLGKLTICVVTFLPVGPLGWEKPLDAYRFELDADQVAALIAKLTKSKRKPKSRGRHDHAMKDDILAEYDRRCVAAEPHENADLERWAATELKNSPKYANTALTPPRADTIGRWKREREQEQPTT
jgi:hypothetical protein